MLMLVTTINYLDRTSLSVAGPVLKEKLQINEQQFAFIIMCFQFSYLVMQPVSGRVMDWLGIKRGFSLAAIWWSIANMLHGLARTPISFGAFRALLGVGEAGNFPGVAKTISEWFPARERTMATGIANIGAGTGSLIATPMVAWIIIRFGWQTAFVITGAIGFVWVILWVLLYKSPAQNPFITSEELEYINRGQKELQAEESGPAKNVWKLILGQRNFWGIALARFLSEPAWQFFSYWIPLYFATQRGLNLKQIGLFLWLPFLAADIGSFVGGVLSPFYQNLGFKVLTAQAVYDHRRLYDACLHSHYPGPFGRLGNLLVLYRCLRPSVHIGYAAHTACRFISQKHRCHRQWPFRNLRSFRRYAVYV